MKKVFQYDKNGKLVQEHQSARSLDEHYGISPDTFRKHIDTQSLYKGYYWSYSKADDYSDIAGRIIKEETIKDDTPYSVIDGYYVWNSKRGKITLSVEQADQMFQNYSEKGMNKSQAQMIRKYGLEPYEWNSIKNTLGLYKQSHIFSPYTIETTPKSEMKDMVQKKIESLYEDQGAVIEDAYHKATLKKYKQAIEQYHAKSFAHESMVAELSGLLPELEPVKIREAQETSNIKTLNVVIADLHTGAGVKNLKVTPNFNIDILEFKLLRLANLINEYKAQEVVLHFLGDNIESFTGLNHKDSWKSIESGFYGAKVVYQTLNLITRFISHVNNVEKVSAIGGNHDRGASSKKEEANGEIAKLIFLLLRDNIGTHIDIEYNDHIGVNDTGNIRAITIHGDHGNAKKPEKMVNDYGNPDMFNLVLAGHLHTREIKADSHNVRFIRCAPIFTGNDYSERNGWTSSSGATLFYDTEFGVPTVIDQPL